MTDLDKKIDEILPQYIQFTHLGGFPQAVPRGRDWVNVMGQVYAIDFTEVKEAIKSLIKEEAERHADMVVGESEEVIDKTIERIESDE